MTKNNKTDVSRAFSNSPCQTIVAIPNSNGENSAFAQIVSHNDSNNRSRGDTKSIGWNKPID